MTAGLTSKLNVLNSPHVGALTQAPLYKPSSYNHFVERDDTVWAANFLSGSFLRIPKTTYLKVCRILDGERGGELESLTQDLVRQRFLVPHDFDEMNLLKAKNRVTRFGKYGLTMIVAPTLRCNFACDYCYVDLNANKMKPEDRVKLGKFFDRKLPKNTGAEIVWTGGDPSLATDVVEDLSARFLESCERKGCTYLASLITNGYLLDDTMRRRLRNSKVVNLQISLDGSKEFHDQIRCLPNGKPTYDRIMENVEATCDEFRIFLRVNVDSKNRHAILDLIDDLEQRNLKERLFVYFAHVDDVNENSAAHHDSCLAAEEYAKVEAALLKDALERGFRIGGRVFNEPVKTFCGANSMNYFVVDSKVNLYKCYHDFGQADEYGIGHIDEDGEEVVTNPYNLMKWLGWDPFEIDDCRECKVLPLCMGGCSHKIMNSGMQIERGCIKMRFTTDEMVEMYGQRMAGRPTASSGCSGCAVTAHV